MKKNKPYFLQKIKVKKLKCRLLQFLFGALRVSDNSRIMFILISPKKKRFCPHI